MTVYKLGDRVRVVKEGELFFGIKKHNAKLGEEGTITQIINDEMLIVDFGRHFPENDSTIQAMEDDELEKVEG